MAKAQWCAETETAPPFILQRRFRGLLNE